jgi:hypothetical protein
MISNGIDEYFANNLIDVLYTLSELRLGALVLIVEGEEKPNIIGKIDTTELGTALCSTMQVLCFNELRQTNSIIGLLTSDGLTSFDKLGNLIDCGAIIDLNAAEEGVKITGGGRSQAACAASKYGLSIKVSEDGPIALYKHCNKLFEWR